VSAVAEQTAPIHDLADVYPMLSDVELRDLADDIAANGQRTPITLDPSGRVVDGRNRLAACRLAGVEPWTVTDPSLDSDADVAAFVQAANNRRRHLSAGQVAAADALLMCARGLRRDGRWAYGSLSQDLGKAEREALRKAGLVADYVPDLLPRVVAGGLSLDAAYTDAVLARSRAGESPAVELPDHYLEAVAKLADQLADDAKRRPPRPPVAPSDPRRKPYQIELRDRARDALLDVYQLLDLVADDRWADIFVVDVKPSFVNDLHRAHRMLGEVIEALPPGVVDAWQAAQIAGEGVTP
jgi:hypothetical protein